jgi:alpha-galactosidase
MSQLDDFTLNLLTNDEVLAVDQDALGRGADKIYEKDQLQVWEKELSDGSHALGIFNLGEKAAQAVIPLSDLHLAAQAQLRDLWRQQDLGVVKTAYRGAIPAHGVLFLKAKAAGNRK